MYSVHSRGTHRSSITCYIEVYKGYQMVGAHDVVSVIRKCPFQQMSINRSSTAARFVYNQLVKVASRFFLLHR